MIIPAMFFGSNRCPYCGGIHMVVVEMCAEEHYLDPDGYPVAHTEQGVSFMRCISCKRKYPFLGNGIDGFSIDDGTYTDEPEFEPQSVTFNPFYREADYD